MRYALLASIFYSLLISLVSLSSQVNSYLSLFNLSSVSLVRRISSVVLIAYVAYFPNLVQPVLIYRFCNENVATDVDILCSFFPFRIVSRLNRKRPLFLPTISHAPVHVYKSFYYRTGWVIQCTPLQS